MDKQYIVLETIPVMAFRTIEGAEDFVEHMEETDGGMYEIMDTSEDCPVHAPQPVYGNGEVY